MGKYGLRRAATAALLGATVAAINGSVDAAENDPLQIETIVVTAQKRKENVQDVPISVTAFSGDKLEKIGATDIESIANNTPGLNFTNGFNRRETMPTLRGVSSTSFTAGGDPAVGIYVDDVYMGGPAGSAIDLFDIERVEVLRGPQGTLFGRNTTGGVINVSSRRPTDDLEGYIQSEFGNYGHIRVKGGVSGPINPGVLTGSIGALSFDRKGFLTSEALGHDVNDTHEKGLRASLRLTTTKNSEWLATFDYMRVNQTANGVETLKNYPANAPFLPPGGKLPNNDPWDRVIYEVDAGAERIESQGLSVRGRISFENFDLISVSAFRKYQYYDRGQVDQTPVNAGWYGDPEKARRFTQEIRLESTGKNRLNWIIGTYYLNQHSNNESLAFAQGDFANAIGAPKTVMGSFATGTSESSSLFGNIGYEFTDRLDASFGGRYTSEKKSINFAQVDPLGIIGGESVFTGNKKYSNFTPTINGRYRLAKDLMTYATYSEGFKGGGFTEGLRSATANIEYGPEHVKNMEIGIKSRWLQNRLQLNASLFRLKWNDMQIRQDDPTTPAFDAKISNAGKAVSKGAEFELTARATRDLNLGANLALLNAKFTAGPFAGKDLQHAPKQTISLNAEYRIFSTDSRNLTVRGDVTRQSSIWFRVTDNSLSGGANNPLDAQEAYTLVNGRVTYSDANDKWRLSFWGKNLTDKKYKANVFDLSTLPFAGQYYIALGAPRTLGVDVRYNF